MRTYVNLRTIGAALGEHAVVHGRYPCTSPPRNEVDDGRRLMPWSRAMPRPLALVRNELVPECIKDLPTRDGWGNSMYYDSDGTHYAILALGRGATMEPWTWRKDGPGPTQREDFIFTDGQFFKY